MKTLRQEEGQTLVFTALCMMLLLGFAALAIDVGVLFRAHRRIQIAADAAAVAAGLAAEYNETVTCGSSVAGTAGSNVKCAAANAAGAIANGSVDPSQLTVNQPPASGYHLGAEYIEVIVRQPNPTVFMAAFSGDYKTVTVATRAVSGIVPGQNCMISLNPHVADAVDVQGNATIVTPNCSVQINSDNDTALCSTGNKSSIQSIAINIVGAQDLSGKCNKGQPNASTGATPVPDPFDGLSTPTCKTGTGGNTFSVGGVNPTITAYNASDGSVTLQNKAGTKVTATPSKQDDGSGTATAPYMNVVCFSDANLQLASGLVLGDILQNEMFVFQGNVTLGGTVTINGTMDITGTGTLTQGNKVLNMTAPTSDQNYLYNGISIYYTSTANSCDSSYKGPDAACFQAQFGSGYGHLDGMVYAPKAAVYLQDSGGNSGPTVFTAVIADVIWDKSALLEITDNYNYVHTTSPLDHVALVE